MINNKNHYGSNPSETEKPEYAYITDHFGNKVLLSSRKQIFSESTNFDIHRIKTSF